jgi:hypothetical protein
MRNLTDWAFLIIGISGILLLTEGLVMATGTQDRRWKSASKLAHLITNISSMVLFVVGLSMVSGMATGIPQNIASKITCTGMIFVGIHSYFRCKRPPDWMPDWQKRFGPFVAIFIIALGGIFLLLFWIIPN